MKKRSAWLDNTVAAVALFVAAAIVYGLAYRLTVTRVPGSASEVTVIHWQPQYRVANPLCQRLFQPAHQVDRRLRPSFWQQRITIDEHLWGGGWGVWGVGYGVLDQPAAGLAD